MQWHHKRAKDCRALWLEAHRPGYLPGHGRRIPRRRAHLYQCGRDSLWRGAGTEPATVTAIDELYTRCGIAHTVESDIAHRMWAKLMLNDGINQTCMAYGGTYGSATEPGSEQRRCFVSAMRETLAVANAEGIELTEADLTQMVHLIEGIDPAGMPSMAQDRVARRKTEVDEFAGTICRLAAKHNIQAPQNEWLYQRIRDIEKSW